jgi:GTP-binding protein LepA
MRNKVDLPAADPEGCTQQIKDILAIDQKPILASAKSGIGIQDILNAVIDAIPPANTLVDAPLKALVFDSVFDNFRGVIVYVRILEGTVREGMDLTFMNSNFRVTVDEVGVFKLKYVKQESLSAGEVGYLMLGLKELSDVRVGDTLTQTNRPAAQAHPGYKDLKPFVFAGLYPINASDYDNLKKALDKLHLTDSAFQYSAETSTALGFGFRAGFLGLLHLDIIKTRVEREFEIPLIVTAPLVN